MARSTYVYTIQRWCGDCWLLAGAFTVKHEMMTRLQREAVPCGSETKIMRHRDGLLDQGEDITKQLIWRAS